jgi:energy-coupling factor transport system ATP-binding protein
VPVEIRHLSHVYMKGTPFETKAIDDISLTIADGEFLGVIGHTGSGKSTLIAHLNALIRPEEGQVLVNGMDIARKDADLVRIRREVGLVFQYPEYQLFEETVERDIAFGPKNLGIGAAETAERVREAIGQVGLPEDVAQRSPFELSGGQKRRVAIAGVLAMRPSVLVLDEPAAGLDPAGRREMLDLIKSIHSSGRTIIMVSHSMDDVGRLCDRVAVLNRGKIAYLGAPAEVFQHPDELAAMGLGVPASVRLAMRLRARGFEIPDDVTSVEALAEAILNNCEGRRADA